MKVKLSSQKNIKNLADPAITISYGLAVLVFQCIYIIVPLRMIISNGFMTWVSPAMAVSGIALFVISWIIDPKRYLSKELVIPWLFIIVLIASSASNYDRGLIENIKTIIWQADLMLLIFSSFIFLGKAYAEGGSSNDVTIEGTLAKDMPVDAAVPASAGTGIKAVYYAAIIVMLIWDTAVVVSLIQFFQMSDYTVIAENGWIYHQGFDGGRLFGIITTPYNASILSFYVSVASVCIAVYCRKNRKLKIFCIVSAFLAITMIVLSGTRSVMLGILFSCAVIVIVVMLKNQRICCHIRSSFFRAVIAVIIALIVSAGVFMLQEGYGRALRYGTTELNSLTLSTKQSNLERTDVSGDISNNRFSIWKDYIHVFMDRPSKMLLGYSPCGYMEYIDKNYPDLYIVSYVKWKYPLMYKIRHEVYATHNSVITVLISTGFAGLALLIALIVQSLKHIVGYYLRCRPGIEDYCMLAVLLTTAVALMFESDIFYQCSATSVVFWMVLGAVFGRGIGSRTSGAVSQTHNKDINDD